LTQNKSRGVASNGRTLRDLAGQEYAEDAGSCFLASGDCVFDLAAIDAAVAGAGQVVQSQDNGRLLSWFPFQKGGGTSLVWTRREVVPRETTPARGD